MIEIKPTWRIAQQISKRHSLISLKITLPLFFGIFLMSILILKILGYQNSGVILQQFFDAHRRAFISSMIFVHLVPVNYYAIMRIFKADFKKFELKIVQKQH